jgi:energy-converting hydrogenase Eha subunit E
MVEEAPPKAQVERQWDLVLFLMAQFLWGALLFIPGSQAYRAVIRALPYVVSVGLLAVYLPRVMKSRSPRGTLPLLLALGLIVMNLLHPSTSLNSGIAQCVFQAAIAAPMFWGWRAIRNVDTLRRLLWITFAFNLVGSVLGVLQVYYPDRFMPPQFSTLGTKMNEFYVESLTYMGPDGQLIVRPPGLSDQPGGAAVSGALTVVLGAGLSLAASTPAGRWATLAAVGIGLAAIYLTQVRSLLLMSIAALGVLALVLFRRGQARIASRVAITAGVLVIGSFLWARSLGGQAVEDRFASITQQGTMRTYQENRGGFVNETFGELLDQYPLGAGVGRWGMMQVYFGDLEKDLPPIHVEIQITGWLLDGGIPMWVLYGGAIVLALLTAYTLSLSRASPALRDVALIVLSVEVLIVGFSWAGPAFNTQLGILFWFLASALYGASREMKSPVLAHRV